MKKEMSKTKRELIIELEKLRSLINTGVLCSDEDFFNSFFQDINEGFAIVSGRKVVWSNIAFKKIFGFGGDDLSDINSDFFFIKKTESYEESISTNDDNSTHFIKKYRRKDGRDVFVDIVKKDMFFNGINSIGIIVKDITEKIIARRVEAFNSENIDAIINERTNALKQTNNYLMEEILKRKKVENDLKNSFEKIKTIDGIINRSPIVVFRWGIEKGWPVEFISENIAQFGFYQEEFLSGNISWVSMIHQEDIPRVEREMEDYANKGINNFIKEYRLIDKTGDIHWVRERSFVIRDENGKIVNYEGILIDITEWKKLKDELQLMSLFTEVSPNIVFLINSENIISYANKKAYEWIKLNLFENLSDLKKLLPAYLPALITMAISDQQVRETETYYSKKYYNFKLTPIKEIDSCLVSLTDITVLKKVSRELEIFFHAFRNSIQALLITDSDGQIIQFNKSFEEFYGYKYDDLKGENPKALNPGRSVYLDYGINNDEYSTLFGDMWKSLRDPNKGFWEGELVNKKKDGTLIWVRLFISAIRDNSGEIVAFLGIPVDISKKRDEELKIRLEIYHTLTELAETKDNETGIHMNRVSKYCCLLAEKMGLPKKYTDDIKIFSPLHDIGKVGIPDNILQSPGKLSNEEFEIMKKHTTLGYMILKGKATLETAAEIVLSHHEHVDGRGYPEGLKGDRIPLSAKIVALADVYDALRSHRVYKEPWPHEKAVAEILLKKGTHFDDKVVDAFIEVEADFRKVFDELND